MKKHLTNHQKYPPVTVVVTALNEERSIGGLIDGLKKQTVAADAVIIAEAKSTDDTRKIILKEQKNYKQLKLISVAGNRSVGRNAGIAAVKTELVAITDSGCIPEPDWLENLLKVYVDKKPDVVSGYYRGLAETPFEEAVVPYALVMPDRLNPETFLPATRSMLLTKKIWLRLGKFDESLSDNEDYVFAKSLQASGATIALAPNAIVNWQPRSSLRAFAKMIFRFARGDIYAGILRPKVTLVFLRYLLVVNLLLLLEQKSILPVLLLFVLYVIWSVAKNLRYTPRGWYWLPVLQVVSDFMVMIGSIAGLLQRLIAPYKNGRIKKP